MKDAVCVHPTSWAESQLGPAQNVGTPTIQVLLEVRQPRPKLGLSARAQASAPPEKAAPTTRYRMLSLPARW